MRRSCTKHHSSQDAHGIRRTWWRNFTLSAAFPVPLFPPLPVPSAPAPRCAAITPGKNDAGCATRAVNCLWLCQVRCIKGLASSNITETPEAPAGTETHTTTLDTRGISFHCVFWQALPRIVEDIGTTDTQRLCIVVGSGML